MKDARLQTVVDHKCLLGEGPVWDARRQRILWVSIAEGVIHQYYPATGEHRAYYAGEMVGAIALRASGSLIAALQSGFAFVDPDREIIQRIAAPEAHLSGNRFNDGKCDPAGRFWAGTMSQQDEPGAGALYTLEKDGTVQRKLQDVSISNGLAWSADSRTFYYIDTPTHRVVAYDYSAATGDILNGRAIIEVPADYGSPDGMTIDAEGMLWIAHWDGWQVIRWNPANGEILSRIELPVARATSCAFGGANLDDLYITSARTGLSDEQLAAQPLAGALFVIKACGFKGLLPAEYGG